MSPSKKALFSIIDIHWVILSGIIKSIYFYLPVFSAAVFTSIGEPGSPASSRCFPSQKKRYKQQNLQLGKFAIHGIALSICRQGCRRSSNLSTWKEFCLACAPVKQKVLIRSICFVPAA